MPCQVESEATQSQIPESTQVFNLKFIIGNQLLTGNRVEWRQLQKCLETCTGIGVGGPHKLSAVAHR